ncbi:helix-turn-helix domain-containing protein [Streptomyces sp. NBC_01578]|uniref:helix-turn-helix domain-containing protein n=1 Tax=Streptomyces sp. NBC_01578 TaxID=2975884 RepID=UPI003862D894
MGKWRRKFAADGLAGLQDAGRIGRPKADLVLSDADPDQLARWARRAKTAQHLALRGKIVLRCAEGGTNRQAAMDLGIDESTVERWRVRFVERGLYGLQDEPRSRRLGDHLRDSPQAAGMDAASQHPWSIIEGSLRSSAVRSGC